MSTYLTEVEDIFRDLFEREWYTNHGPLAQSFEQKLQNIFEVENVVCVVNADIALIMAMEALNLEKRYVLIVGSENLVIKRALHWARLQEEKNLNQCGLIVCCGIDNSEVHGAKLAASRQNCGWIMDCTKGISRDQLDSLVSYMVDDDQPPLMTVMGLHSGGVIDAHGSACILTRNDDLAETLRNIRSSYGVRSVVSVTKTANGRMSEAQAALGLLALNRLKIGVL